MKAQPTLAPITLGHLDLSTSIRDDPLYGVLA